MKVFEEINQILKDDYLHHLKIEIDSWGLSVYLICDPELSFSDDVIIPIRYTTLEEFAYIPDEEYREKFNVSDFGIDSDEIKLIYKIMECLESNKSSINSMCSGFSWCNRSQCE